MDFTSLMSKEMAKSKPSSTSTSNNPSSSSTKYITRREAEQAREAAYLVDQAARDAERAARAEAKRQHEAAEAEEARAREAKRVRLAEESRRRRAQEEAEKEPATQQRPGLPETPPRLEGEKQGGVSSDEEEEDGSGVGVENLADEEVVRRLREMGQPVVLFGEEPEARKRRYARLLRPKRVMGPISTRLNPVAEKDMRVSGEVADAEDRKARKWLFRQLASYFNMVLREWEAALQKEGDPTTLAGRKAIEAMKQSKDAMRPLFRKFERQELEDSILKPIVEIVKAAQERRYVDANDGYLRLSIGKAAWPIGVTMVGIHERSAREKLHDGERGHVMGDEVTRKYLQSIKRCLTFAQVRWPPEDIGQLMG